MGTEILTPPLDLPPLYREVALREGGDAFAHACAIAARAGAGTLVWSRSYRRFDVAVVLEPDRPLGAARLALHAGMVAVADMLAVHAPPETPLAFAWPDRIEIDGAAAGGVRLAWAEAEEAETPAWLVVHAGLRVAFDEGVEPGSCPDLTSLIEQGFEPVEVGRLVESYARHLM
ncbi:MAG: biotin/lipoate--protein ligase family protein, partial [Elioraea sp.]|nr:biotin/lipoate--protein ligase family protein [Elioraea sp.]